MNTPATYLPTTTVNAKMRVWAFSAAVRLSDQDKPIALKLLLELAIVIRMLAQLAQNARCRTGKTVIARRAARPVARTCARRMIPVTRTAAVHRRQSGVVGVRRTVARGATTSVLLALTKSAAPCAQNTLAAIAAADGEHPAGLLPRSLWDPVPRTAA
jgi:hypothetical protein